MTTAPSRAMISAVARPIPLAKAVMTATLPVNRIAPPFRLRCGQCIVIRDQHGRTSDATRNAPAACGIASNAGVDQTPCTACRGPGAQRRVGQRTHHRAARPVSALAVVLRSDPDPDLGCV